MTLRFFSTTLLQRLTATKHKQKYCTYKLLQKYNKQTNLLTDRLDGVVNNEKENDQNLGKKDIFVSSLAAVQKFRSLPLIN